MRCFFIISQQMFKLGRTMSSPTKQVSIRRLPPLPNQLTQRNIRETVNSNNENHAGGSIKTKPSGGKPEKDLFFKFSLVFPSIKLGIIFCTVLNFASIRVWVFVHYLLWHDKHPV